MNRYIHTYILQDGWGEKMKEPGIKWTPLLRRWVDQGEVVRRSNTRTWCAPLLNSSRHRADPTQPNPPLTTNVFLSIPSFSLKCIFSLSLSLEISTLKISSVQYLLMLFLSFLGSSDTENTWKVKGVLLSLSLMCVFSFQCQPLSLSQRMGNGVR